MFSSVVFIMLVLLSCVELLFWLVLFSLKLTRTSGTMLRLIMDIPKDMTPMVMLLLLLKTQTCTMVAILGMQVTQCLNRPSYQFNSSRLDDAYF